MQCCQAKKFAIRVMQMKTTKNVETICFDDCLRCLMAYIFYTACLDKLCCLHRSLPATFQYCGRSSRLVYLSSCRCPRPFSLSVARLSLPLFAPTTCLTHFPLLSTAPSPRSILLCIVNRFQPGRTADK